MIELWRLTLQETAELLAGAMEPESLRGSPVAAEALGPDIVRQFGMERLQRGEEWFWCAQRLFYCPDAGRVVGSACYKGWTADGKMEIGYGIAPGWQGRGYATAGVAAILKEVAVHFPAILLYAECSVANPASARVLERNGFRLSGQRYDPEDGSVDCWCGPRI